MHIRDFVSTLRVSVGAAALAAYGVPGAVFADGLDANLATPTEVAQSTSATGEYEVISGRRSPKAQLLLSGHINKALLYADDGNSSDVFIVDNDNSSTRFRLLGTGRFNENVTIGTRFEVQMESNSTTLVNLNNSERGLGVSGGAPANNGFAERYAEFTITHKQLGKLYLGQGDMASNGTSEMDHSGTNVVQYSSIPDFAGGQLFRDKNATTASAATAAGGATGVFAGSQTIQSSYSSMDGLSRDDRIRYDTANLAGFVASAGYAAGGSTDFALRHSGKFGAFTSSAAVAIANSSSIGTVDNQINGSLSVLHEGGLSVTVAAGFQDLEDQAATRNDPRFFYGKIGYIAKIFNFGTTRFAVDYAQADDVGTQGDSLTAYSIAIVQAVDDLGALFYVAARNHELDTASSTKNFDDVIGVMAGARVGF